jgi:hypothetical protein
LEWTENLKGKEHFGRRRRRRENNIKMDVRGEEFEGVDWIQLVGVYHC